MRGEPIGLGIIGTGRWADAHAEAAARSDRVAIVACFSPSEERRASYAARHGISHIAHGPDELIGNDEVEAVIVSSPNDLHFEHAAMVASTGKPTLVDKPLTVDLGEGLQLLRDTSLAPVGVAHHARRLAGHRFARRWIESGEAGQVRIAHADFSNPRGARLPDNAWYKTARGSEAGVLIQVGIHQVENLLYLLGPAETVTARFAYEMMGPSLPDAAILTISHRGRAISALTTCWTTPGHYRLDLLATEGNLEYWLDHSRWSHPDVDDSGELTLATTGSRQTVPLGKGDPLREQLEELGAAARRGSPAEFRAMEVGIVEGLRAVAVIEAAVRSASSEGAR
ncbi:MAG: Gfo/Idh/MocA family protein, partial [Acidimicrobiia bacterium]